MLWAFINLLISLNYSIHAKSIPLSILSYHSIHIFIQPIQIISPLIIIYSLNLQSILLIPHLFIIAIVIVLQCNYLSIAIIRN